MQIHGISVKGKKRDENQDGFLADENLWAVADGVGGLDAGQMAAFLFLFGLRQEMLQCKDRAAAENGLAWAQMRMADYVHRRVLHRMGACGTVAWCAGPEVDGMYPVHLQHIGDTAAVVVANGVAQRLTVPHVYQREDKRTVVDRYVGNRTDADFGESIEECVPKGAWLLLMTDDVARRVEDVELASAVKEYGPRGPYEVSNRIIGLAQAFGATDDLTVVAVHFDEN